MPLFDERLFDPRHWRCSHFAWSQQKWDATMKNSKSPPVENSPEEWQRLKRVDAAVKAKAERDRERQAQHRRNQEDKGMKRVTAWVHSSRFDEARAFCRSCQSPKVDPASTPPTPTPEVRAAADAAPANNRPVAAPSLYMPGGREPNPSVGLPPIDRRPGIGAGQTTSTTQGDGAPTRHAGQTEEAPPIWRPLSPKY